VDLETSSVELIGLYYQSCCPILWISFLSRTRTMYQWAITPCNNKRQSGASC